MIGDKKVARIKRNNSELHKLVDQPGFDEVFMAAPGRSLLCMFLASCCDGLQDMNDNIEKKVKN